MRRLPWMIGIFLSLGISGFAQGGFGGGQPVDDHNDAAPVQTGYAVVTPATTGPGLTVMETLGLKGGEGTDQAALPGSELITSATLFVDVAERLGRNVGVALANPNAGAASITFTLRKNDGTQLGTRTISLAPRNQTAQFVSELIPIQSSGGGFGGQPALLTEYTGTLSITSSVAISVMATRFRGPKFSTIPVTGIATTSAVPILSQGIGGAGAILLPHFAAGGGWATQIVISNANSSAATVRLDLFKPDGTSLTTTLNRTTGSSFISLSVPANGVLVLAPRDVNGDDRF